MFDKVLNTPLYNLRKLKHGRSKKSEMGPCMRSVRIRSFSGPYFPALGLNTERYSVCGKTRTRKTPNKDSFHAVVGSEYVQKVKTLTQMKTCKLGSGIELTSVNFEHSLLMRLIQHFPNYCSSCGTSKIVNYSQIFGKKINETKKDSFIP